MRFFLPYIKNGSFFYAVRCHSTAIKRYEFYCRVLLLLLTVSPLANLPVQVFPPTPPKRPTSPPTSGNSTFAAPQEKKALPPLTHASPSSLPIPPPETPRENAGEAGPALTPAQTGADEISPFFTAALARANDFSSSPASSAAPWMDEAASLASASPAYGSLSFRADGALTAAGSSHKTMNTCAAATAVTPGGGGMASSPEKQQRGNNRSGCFDSSRDLPSPPPKNFSSSQQQQQQQQQAGMALSTGSSPQWPVSLRVKGNKSGGGAPNNEAAMESDLDFIRELTRYREGGVLRGARHDE